MAYNHEVLEDNPVGYWRFEETSGTTAEDSSGGGRHGDLLNGPNLNVEGMVGSGVDFEPGGHLHVDHHADLDTATGDFSVELWFNMPVFDGTTTYEVVAKWDAGNAGFRIRFRNDNLMRFDVSDGTDAATVTSSAIRPADLVGAWHHSVLQRDGEVLRWFIDGSEVSTSNGGGSVDYESAGSLDLSNVEPFRVAARETGSGLNESFEARVDEVAFYDYALSPTRIEDHFNADTEVGVPTPSNFTFVKVDNTRQIDASADTVSSANNYELEWEEWDGASWLAMGIESNTTPSFTLTDADGVDWETTYRGRMRALE